MAVPSEDFRKRFDWWCTDMAFKAPEVLTPAYVMGAVMDLAELVPSEQLKPRTLAKGEWKDVLNVFERRNPEDMLAFLQDRPYKDGRDYTKEHTDALAPERVFSSLEVLLGSIARHAEEICDWLEAHPGEHQSGALDTDIGTVRALLEQPNVKVFMEAADAKALLPVKR